MEENLRGVELGVYSDAIGCGCGCGCYCCDVYRYLRFAVVFLRFIVFLLLLFRRFFTLHFRRVLPPPFPPGGDLDLGLPGLDLLELDGGCSISRINRCASIFF